tara:strand:- start:59 stop:538 length:480 start_codon:yes stop_codon:yes gene_type:complete
LILFGCDEDKSILIAGNGTSEYPIGQIKVKDLVKRLGDDYKFTQGITDGYDWAEYTNRYIYPNGITFIAYVLEEPNMNEDTALIDCLVFDSPLQNHTKTKKGIEIGFSTPTDVIEAYGNVYKMREDSGMQIFHYGPQGISIEFNKETNTVSSIRIYKSY